MTTPAYPRPLPPGWSAEWTGAGWIVGPESDEDVLGLPGFAGAAQMLKDAAPRERPLETREEAA